MGYTTLNKLPRLRLGELGTLGTVSVNTLRRVHERGFTTIARVRAALADPTRHHLLGVDGVELAALQRALNTNGGTSA